MNANPTTTTIEDYTLIEKGDLPFLKPGFRLAWKEQEWGMAGEGAGLWVEGYLVDYIVRSSNRALVRCRATPRAEWVNKFRLYRISLPQIEDIDQIYNYDE